MRRAVPRWWVLRQRGTVVLARFGPTRVGVIAVLLLGWLVAVVLAVVTSEVDLTCTPADPSVCGPEAGAAWIGLALATPVLLCWRPRLGAVAGVVFAVAEFAFDGDPAGHVPFGVHGVLCVIALVVLRPVGRSGGSAVAHTSYRRGEEPPRRHPYFDDADEEPWVLLRRLSAAVVGWGCALAALICVGWYAQLVSTEHHHVAAAVQVLGTVDDVDADDYSITLLIAEPDGEVRPSGPVDVLDVGPYPRDTTVPVLVDPRDTGWVRLVAEPQDATGWLVAATFMGSLAVAVGVDRRPRRRAGST